MNIHKSSLAALLGPSLFSVCICRILIPVRGASLLVLLRLLYSAILVLLVLLVPLCQPQPIVLVYSINLKLLIMRTGQATGKKKQLLIMTLKYSSRIRNWHVLRMDEELSCLFTGGRQREPLAPPPTSQV